MNNSIDWDFVVAQAERTAKEIEFGNINLQMKIHKGRIVTVEEVETVKRTWMHKQREPHLEK